jgi:hypothetical protein
MGLLGKTVGVAVVVLALFMAASDAPAAPATKSRRLVQWFNFEERDQGNWDNMPRYWFAVGRDPKIADANFHHQVLHKQLINRPGFPAHAEMGFDDKISTSGQNSFHLKINGGSAAAFLQVGTVVAVPHSDYLITAKMRTASLQRAAAGMVAYFVDEQGQRIEASVQTTPLRATQEQWTSVSIQLLGDFPDAAWIGMEVQLLQPQPRPNHPLGRHQIVLQDVRGDVWFDDITVWQLPHVEVTTQSAINIIRAPQKPQLTMNVRDLTGQQLEAELTVYDHTLTPVAQQRQAVGAGQPSSWTWTPPLPQFGWYLLDMLVRDVRNPDARPVAHTMGAVLWMDQKSSGMGAQASRFALMGEDLPDNELELLPRILEITTGNVAILSAWDKMTTLETLDIRQERLDDLIHGIRNQGGQVMLSLGTVPLELAQTEGVDAAAPLAVFRAQANKWQPYLAPILMRHGHRVHYWQLGSIDQPDAFFYPDLPEIIKNADRHFRALAPQPRLVIPWRIDQSRRGDVFTNSEVTYLIDVPPAVTPPNLAAHLEPWRSPPADFWLFLRQVRADEMSHERRVTDLALRMIYSWQADPMGLTISRPWTRADERRNATLPDPLLGVFSNVSGYLANRRMTGKLALGSGLECMVLNGPAGGMLVAWNDKASATTAKINMYLGKNPVAIDVWGNRTPIPLIEGKHVLALTHTPIFIDGIDPQLAQFRSHFSVQPTCIESVQGTHKHTITLSNPWNRTISGNMRFTGPQNWSFVPPQHFFSIASGRSVVLPLTMRFRISEVAGDKMVTANFKFIADKRYDVDLAAALRLGLKNIDFVATLALEPGIKPGTTDAVMAAVVTNTGGETMSLYLFALLRGHRRQELPIPRLEPGQSIVRRFRFADAADAIASYPLRTGVRATNGPEMLNFRLTADDIK